jgi:hypothetical protein
MWKVEGRIPVFHRAGGSAEIQRKLKNITYHITAKYKGFPSTYVTILHL